MPSSSIVGNDNARAATGARLRACSLISRHSLIPHRASFAVVASGSTALRRFVPRVRSHSTTDVCASPVVADLPFSFFAP